MRQYTWVMVLWIVCSQGESFGNNYYVMNTGDDSNSGSSWADPFRTIQRATDLVLAGDTVFVANGVYSGFDVRSINGTSSAPIVFMAAGTDVLINQPGPIRDDGINVENADYVILDGFVSNDMPGNGNGIRLVLSDHCVVRNCRCDNNAERGIFTGFTDDILIEYNVCSNSIDEHGIYVSNSSDRPIIRFNECFGNNAIGIHMNADASLGGDGIISDAQIYGNILYNNNRAAGINMDGLQDPIVYNNLIFNNHFAQGIALFQQDGAIVTNGARIFNNTIIVPSDGRWGILVKDGGNENTEIFNNIIINQHAWRGCIAIEDTAGFQSEYNVVNDKMSASGDGSTISLADWREFGFDTASQLAGDLSNLFVDIAGSDYNLTAGSRAIDKGTDRVMNIVIEDIVRTQRPQSAGYDIGAYEYVTTTEVEPSYIGHERVRLSPSPSNDIIRIEGSEECFHFKGFDSSGQMIELGSNICLPTGLDISSLRPGRYYIIGYNWNSNKQLVLSGIKTD